MNFAPFKEVTEISVKHFSECPLGKLAENKVFDKPMSEYDKPLAEICNNKLISGNQLEVSEVTRPLTDEEKEYYKGIIGCSDYLLDNATIDENGKIHIKTINDGKEGQEGENGVKYERKTITVNGVEVEGVFPAFDSVFDTQLPKDLLEATDAKQMECCNKKLKEAVENDPKLAKQFTSEQLKQIKNGDAPDGYTWHHNEETGKMQLVKTEDHQANRHTGGKAIWGGGKENR